jgi:hypothetical protein
VEVGYSLGGLNGLRVVLRDLLWLRIRGRATSPAEAGLLREWLAAEVEDQAAYWLARFTGGTPDDAPEEAALVEVPEPAEAPAALLTCSSCGSLFGVPAGRPGRPRRRCYTCSPPR